MPYSNSWWISDDVKPLIVDEISKDVKSLIVDEISDDVKLIWFSVEGLGASQMI